MISARILRPSRLRRRGLALGNPRAPCGPRGRLGCREGHIIVTVTRAKLIESPTPNFGPRTTKITPFAFRNRATPIPREP
jgi:hypothetical protein